ncbi:MAG: hypothetical protein ACREAF_03825 [Nitrosopumilaceae archaeon]
MVKRYGIRMNLKEVTKILGKPCIFGPMVFVLLASLALISFSSIPAFAQQNEEAKTDYEFTIVTGEELKKNPIPLKFFKT